MRFRHEEAPANWLLCAEFGEKIGIAAQTVSSWIRHGYVTPHFIGQTRYIDWDEAVKSRLIQQQIARYQAYLASDTEEPLPEPKKIIPIPVHFEQLFKAE